MIWFRLITTLLCVAVFSVPYVAMIYGYVLLEPQGFWQEFSLILPITAFFLWHWRTNLPNLLAVLEKLWRPGSPW